MEKGSFKYPSENYYDFKHGHPVSDSMINKWISEGIDSIIKKANAEPNRQDFFSTISSGSTKVLVEAYRQSDKELFTIYVSVIDGYMQQSEISVKL